MLVVGVCSTTIVLGWRSKFAFTFAFFPDFAVRCLCRNSLNLALLRCSARRLALTVLRSQAANSVHTKFLPKTQKSLHKTFEFKSPWSLLPPSGQYLRRCNLCLSRAYAIFLFVEQVLALIRIATRALALSLVLRQLQLQQRWTPAPMTMPKKKKRKPRRTVIAKPPKMAASVCPMRIWRWLWL